MANEQRNTRVIRNTSTGHQAATLYASTTSTAPVNVDSRADKSSPAAATATSGKQLTTSTARQQVGQIVSSGK